MKTMLLTTQKILIVAALLVFGSTAAAQSPSQRGYNLFNPVPGDRLRPLSADRPDATESPQTVDAGHLQLEMDIAAYLRDRSDAHVDGWAFAVTNIKLGLTHNVDLQLVVAPYSYVETRVGGTTTIAEGFGDLVLRTKVNLWGNDGDTKTAFAVMPFISFPTGRDDLGSDEVEGGIIFPLSVDLPRGWGLGLQLELDVVRNSSDTGYQLDIANTIVLGHDIVGPLAGFVEFSSLFPGDSEAGWIGTLNVGLTYAIDQNTQLDVGAFLGLSSEAEDVVVFLGITRRF